jgi:hypothetical protein
MFQRLSESEYIYLLLRNTISLASQAHWSVKVSAMTIGKPLDNIEPVISSLTWRE